MAVIARMACGCCLSVDGETPPDCKVHRETRVTSASTPPPRITAVGCKATGPLVTQKET